MDEAAIAAISAGGCKIKRMREKMSAEKLNDTS
jgi:hypothetical protein